MTAQTSTFSLRNLGALSRTYLLSDPALVDLLRLLDHSSRTPRADHLRWCRAAGVDPRRVATVAAASKRALCRLLGRVGATGSHRVDRVTDHLDEWQRHRLVSWWRGEVLFVFPEHVVRGDRHANRAERRAETPWAWWGEGAGPTPGPAATDEPIGAQPELPLGVAIDREPIDRAIDRRSDRFYIGTEEDEREPSRAGAREPDPSFDELADRVVRAAVQPYHLTDDARERLRSLADEHGITACHDALDRGESLRRPVGWLRATLERGPIAAELPPETAIEARIRGCIPLRDGRPAVIRLDAESRAQIVALVEAHGEGAILAIVPEAGSCDLPVQRIQQILADRAAAAGGEGSAWKAGWRERQARELSDRAAVRAAAKARRRQQRAQGRADAQARARSEDRPPADPALTEPTPEAVELVEDPEAAAEWARRLPTLRANFPSMSAIVTALVAVGMAGPDVVLDGPIDERIWLSGNLHVLEAAGAVLAGCEAVHEANREDPMRLDMSRRIVRSPAAEASGLAKLREAVEVCEAVGCR